jgi:hypothetical protein
MLGKDSQAYKQIEENMKSIISGVVVAIDPSIGSSSSMPGYAVYRVGELIESGTFVIEHRGVHTADRLRSLHNHVRKLYAKYDPDVLVYEDIPASRHGGSAGSQASLLKAVGAILAVPGTTGHVGIYPVSWKSEARDTYVKKGDEADAVEIGYVAIAVAKRIRDSLNKKKKSK